MTEKASEDRADDRWAVVCRYNYYAGSFNAKADHVLSWHESREDAENVCEGINAARTPDKIYQLSFNEYAAPDVSVMPMREVLETGIETGDND